MSGARFKNEPQAHDVGRDHAERDGHHRHDDVSQVVANGEDVGFGHWGLGHGCKEEENGEDDEVNRALQYRGAAGGERHCSDEEREHQQRRLLGVKA